MKTLPLALAVAAITLTSLCDAAVKTVVLVHGAFADGSGWKPVAEILECDGYTVYVVQMLPLRSNLPFLTSARVAGRFIIATDG